jgi:hypothetical protein
MTVIACKDGVMAADSSVWTGNIWMPSAESKLRRMSDGAVMGLAGWWPEIEAAIRWYQDGAKPDSRPAKPDEGDLDILILTPQGKLWNLCNNFRLYRSEWPLGVAGSHTEFVLGALMAGASAKQAVEQACRHCSHARGPVTTMRLE